MFPNLARHSSRDLKTTTCYASSSKPQLLVLELELDANILTDIGIYAMPV
jgi:hypothetical protein